tara:strand:- start:658 stop:1053 length:396 start_codon:yes stop_codon:yes gene_type:complete
MGPRELAKRILRSRGIIYNGSPALIRDIRRSLLTAIDSNPKINVVFESILENESGLTVLNFMGAEGAIIGGSEPQDMDILWLGEETQDLTQKITTSIVELATAGYPGCSGCVDDLDWSESLWRDMVLKDRE